MKWVKNQVTIFITLAILLGGGLVTWGRMRQICEQVEHKADKEAVMREMDQIQDKLDRIESRLDGVIVQRAIIRPQE